MEYNKIRVRKEMELSQELYQQFRGDIVRLVLKMGRVEADRNHWRSIMEGHAFKITERMEPNLYRSCMDAKERLEFDEPVEFFVQSSPDINCSAVQATETGQSHLVMINAGAVERFDDEELRFVLGHEIGHLVSETAIMHQVIRFIFPDPGQVPLVFHNRIALWDKLSELSADRCGFIVCPDMNKCLSAFFKMSSGLDTRRVAFNPDAYLAEMEDVLEYFKQEASLFPSTHPVNPIRVKALQHFSQSKLYEGIKTRQPLPDDEELLEQLHELTGILVHSGYTQMDALRARFIAAGGLIMATADEQVSGEEVDRILGALAQFVCLPSEYLRFMVDSGKVHEIFESSVEQILELNPGERHDMFEFLARVVIADKDIHEEELKMLFGIGQEKLKLSAKEVAQITGAVIQREFVPRFGA